MTNVVALKPEFQGSITQAQREAANAHVIGLLERALVRAKSGETTSVAIAEVRHGEDRDVSIATGYSAASHEYYVLHSAASQLATRMGAE